MKKIVGFWNPSVILTYLGLEISVFGMYLAARQVHVNYVFVCFILAGICDVFDGAVARKIKRTEEEKAFGIELDSLADVISFVVFPIIIFCRLGYLSIAHLVVYLLFAVAGIARLGYFNVTTADSEGPVKHYMGLPVTYTALIFPIFYPIAALAEKFVPTYYSLPICMLAVAFLEVLKVRVAKPKGIAYAIVSFFAILYIVYYIVSAH